jgi:hypothetical protein
MVNGTSIAFIALAFLFIERSNIVTAVEAPHI